MWLFYTVYVINILHKVNKSLKSNIKMTKSQ